MIIAILSLGLVTFIIMIWRKMTILKVTKLDHVNAKNIRLYTNTGYLLTVKCVALNPQQKAQLLPLNFVTF